MNKSQWQSLCALIEEQLTLKGHAAFKVSYLNEKLNINGNLREELQPFMTDQSCPYICKFGYGDQEISFRRK